MLKKNIYLSIFSLCVVFFFVLFYLFLNQEKGKVNEQPYNVDLNKNKVEKLEADVNRMNNVLEVLGDELKVLRRELSESKRVKENVSPDFSEDEGVTKKTAMVIAHEQWLENEYPLIVGQSQENAKKILTALNKEMTLSKEKLYQIEPVFVESSIKIADVFAYSEDVTHIADINVKIQEVNAWKESQIKSILSEGEYKQYREIDFMSIVRNMN